MAALRPEGNYRAGLHGLLV